MARFKKDKRIKKIIITENNGKGNWQIEYEGGLDIAEACDALLAAYLGGVEMLIKSGTPDSLIKEITMNALNERLNKEEAETPCTTTH